jgi:transmembrane protein EpsG
MGVFWLNLCIVYILSFFARYFSKPSPILPDAIKPNKLLIFLVIVVLVLVSGLRNNIGDTFFYMYSYELNNFTWNQIKEEKDIGFGILQMLLKKISNDPQLMLLVTALITNALIITVLTKYSRLLELSIYVYITSGSFLTSMNGIRQYFAAAIIFTATPFLIKGDFKKYLLIIIAASTFHQSALILIPIYFLVRFEAWSKATLFLILSAVLIVIGFDQFTSVLFSTIEDTQYSVYQNFDGGGANIIRVIVDAAPILIAYFGREKLRSIFLNSDYIVNMAILGLVFTIISTQNWIFARFSIYFGLYQLILISWIVKLFCEKDQRLVYYGIIICYFIYYYYEHVLSLNIIYRSNYLTIFS